MDNKRMNRSDRRKKLIRTLFIVMVCIIVVLFSIIGYLYYNDRKEPYDLTMPYKPFSINTDSPSDSGRTADSFASGLVVSDADGSTIDARLTSTREKGLLFNLETKEACYSQGIYDRVYPASITKIMTAILAVKNGNMSDQITITNEDVNLGSDSQLSGLRAGDVVTMQQLFSALLVYSANDAAMAIARHLGDGDVSKFVDMMNEEAKQLGMTGTHFANPHGLHDENHYTTAYDVYLMLNEAIRYDEITDVMKNSNYKLEIGRDSGDYRAYNLASTDKYLTGEHALPDGVTIMAGKTGTTDAAGSCLALGVQNRYGIPYIAVIMNATGKDLLYKDMDKLLTQTNG